MQNYTGMGWEGENYKTDLPLKEINKRIKKEFKEKHPEFTLSAVGDIFTGGKSITLTLTGGPRAIKQPNEEILNDQPFTGQFPEMERWQAVYEKQGKQINHCWLDDDYQLTEEAREALKDLVNIANSYNYNDSDAQIDYFSTNFYLNVSIGSYDKPYQMKKTFCPKCEQEAKGEAEENFIKDIGSCFSCDKVEAEAQDNAFEEMAKSALMDVGLTEHEAEIELEEFK